MLDDGERLVPGFREARALRVWAGVRPLFQDAKEETESRDVTRSHATLDHLARDGVRGFLTITGGKATTLRLMAEDVVDAMCAQLDVSGPAAPPRSARRTTKTPATTTSARAWNAARRRSDEQLICECELVGRRRLEEAMRRRGTLDLDDIRRSLRLGMGPCQAGFCIYRATGILHAVDRLDGERARPRCAASSRSAGRACGRSSTAISCGRRGSYDWNFQGLLDVDHLDAAARAAVEEPIRRRADRVHPGRRAEPYDVIVVGTGLAGLSAAVRLAESGARVLVLAKGVGATHLSGGTVDVLGYDPDRVTSPAEALARVAPEHPYGRVGADAVGPALEWFKARFADGPLAPYAYVGGLDENLLLPSAIGVPRPSAVVPETLAGGDLRGGGELCVVGFRA